MSSARLTWTGGALIALAASSPAGAVGPHAPDAQAFVQSAQAPDGSAPSANPLVTTLHATSKVADAFASQPGGGGTAAAATSFLAGVAPTTTDERSRLLLVTTSASDLAALLASAGADGGFGAEPGFPSNVLDTSIALSALRAQHQPEGLIARDLPIPAGAPQLFAVDIPADAINLDILISELTGAVEVRIREGAPPTPSDPFFNIVVPNSLIRVGQGGALPLTPGINYVEFFSAAGATVTFRADHFASTGDTLVVNDAAEYLLGTRNADGGWGLAAADDASQLYYSYWALRALRGLAVPLDATAFVLGRQLPGSGFGDAGLPTVFDTSVAIVSLALLGVDVPILAPDAIDYLGQLQQLDGSFHGDAYRTTWVLEALLEAGAPPTATFELFGVASGGFVSVTISGIALNVTTSPGQAPDEVVAAIATAINANAALRGLGLSANALGSRLVTDGTIDGVDVRDPWLATAPVPVPTTGPWGLLVLGLVAAALAARARRRPPPPLGPKPR